MTGKAASARIYGLTLLITVGFFNYLDRMVLAVVLQPIKRDLELSDTQLGMISGLAFALLYATFGLPLARLADRASRVKILTASLVVWSGFTAATGLARGFITLFLVRVGVGVGEAGCVPAAHSMIGDLFPPSRRAFAISLFQAGGLAGLSVGLVVTGALAERFGWRAALACVGLPGLPLALLVATTVREPTRTGGGHTQISETLLGALGPLLRRPALVHLVLALAIGSFGTYGIVQWLPTFLSRTHHLSLAQTGLWSGLSAGVASIIGVLAGGLLSVRLVKRDERWELWFPALGYAVGGLIYGAAFLAAVTPVCIALIALAALITASGGGVALSAVQTFAEPRRRATAIALVLFLSSALGLGVGPLVVGLVSDGLSSRFGVDSLRYALLISVVAMVWAGAHFMRSARSAVHDRLSVAAPA